MPVPDYETLMLPVLQTFAISSENIAALLPGLRDSFHVSNEEAAGLTPSGKVTVLANRAHRARTYLSTAGLLVSPQRNVHQITAQGRAPPAKSPLRIDNALLAEFVTFQDWKDASKATSKGSQTSARPAVDTMLGAASPEELMAKAFQEIDQALQADLLERLYQMDPIQFEQLILDLLKAMGYGTGRLASHLMTRTPGDGGIDGIIHEDALGLDAVYIHAKRYGAENKVGRPAMRQFIGSLSGEGATKGVFVTTSDFSKDGRANLEKVQPRVVLINSDELAKLMINHGVGVRDRQIYVIRRIYEDYFAEPEV